jgi:hypothetical protein
MIAGKGAHKTFDLGQDSIVALAAAVSVIEQDPAAIREFPITPSSPWWANLRGSTWSIAKRNIASSNSRI